MAAVDFRERLLVGSRWRLARSLSTAQDLVITKTEQKDGYRLLTLSYEVEPDDRVPALIADPRRRATPSQAGTRPSPIWHQHAGQYHLGKSEPAGLAGNKMHHTGAALAREGYVVLCPDAICAFEERQDPTGKLKTHWYERFEFLRYVVDGKCLAWKNILDMRRAVDVLAGLDEVNAEQLGCYGHSMGFHTHLAGRTVGTPAEVPGRQLLPANLQGNPRPPHAALLPEFRSRHPRPRGHSRHRCADRASRPAPQLRRKRRWQPDRRSPTRRCKVITLAYESISRPGQMFTLLHRRRAPATCSRRRCGDVPSEVFARHLKKPDSFRLHPRLRPRFGPTHHGRSRIQPATRLLRIHQQPLQRSGQ